MKIGVDIGGSHVGVGLLNDRGTFITKKEKDLNNIEKKENYSEILVENIIDLITKALEEKKVDITEIELIGIAVPGIVSETHIIKAENLHIKNFNIVAEINKFFNVPIYLRNDAKCAALAEKSRGGLQKCDDAIFVTLGTGIGGAVFLGGKLLKPREYEGFEIGHTVIQKNGIQCNCGRKGCFEKYASMKAFKERIAKTYKLGDLNGKEIREFIDNHKEDEKMNNVINEYIDDLAIGLANLANIFEPQKISLGGSFVYFKDLLLEKLNTRIKQKNDIFNSNNIPQIIATKLENDAGIIGATIKTEC